MTLENDSLGAPNFRPSHDEVQGADSSGAGLRLTERWVPFPASISPAAQGFLSRFVTESGALLFRSDYPALDDIEAWRALKLERGQYLDAIAAAMADPSVAVETQEMAGCVVHVGRAGGRIREDRVYMDLHGGALLFGGGDFCRWGAGRAAALHGVTCVAVDYRMPPEDPFPAGLSDCLAVYAALVQRYGAQNVVIGGSSAGGNLAAATCLRARDEGLPLPAGLVLISPELDLTESGDSFQTNRTLDVVLGDSLMPINRLYAAGHDLSNPYVSPLFGDFAKGFPPTLAQAGTRDLFLSNAVRLHRLLLKAGVPVELHVFEGMPHGGFMGAPEDGDLQETLHKFVASCWTGPKRSF